MAEFLPVCDVLFNVISLTGYFCDVVFDLVMGYALLERGFKASFVATISIVLASLLITQVVSLRWYLQVWSEDGGKKGRAPWVPIVLHCLQLGVLWRYARLLAPVDLTTVKHQVRDLCMLRLVHAFCEAAPMLLLQLHILLRDSAKDAAGDLALLSDGNIDESPVGGGGRSLSDLGAVSAALSMFSVCWALASFNKNARRRHAHRLVLTWLGVIFQFLWRLGTISARVYALTVYALVYEYWVFLVIVLHWVSMFLWVMSPRQLYHGERLGAARRARLAALVAALYVFAYVNLHHYNHRQRMMTFYVVMCVENAVLVCAWWGAGGRRPASPAAPALAFAAGLVFMAIYYRYFHVRRLGYLLGEQHGTNSTNASSGKNGKSGKQVDTAIPGVFNCRFSNPVNSAANGRKKKKPTSFVPPPPVAPATAFWRRPLPSTHIHHGGSSENEGSSVGSRVNIQQKLQEKKQKQLAELRVIEEEIKQGKLAKTTPVAEEIYSSLQRQPIPRSKTHIDPPPWPSIEMTHPYQNYPVLPHACNIYPTYTEIKQECVQKPKTQTDINKNNRLTEYNQQPIYYESPATVHNGYDPAPKDQIAGQYYDENNDAYNMYEAGANRCERGSFAYASARVLDSKNYQRCRTPEILLAPHYLDGCDRQVCCHWNDYPNRTKEEVLASSAEESPRDSRAHSDIDSQISLPRSYTLPREFRYWARRARAARRPPSDDGGDGDVDSGDDSEHRSNGSATGDWRAARRPRRHALRKPTPKPETQL